MIETLSNTTPDSGNLKNVAFIEALKDKYKKIREISIPNGHKLSLCSNEEGHIKVADVYLDGKICGAISLVTGHSGVTHSVDDIDQIKIIGDEIYFRSGVNLQKIKDGQIYTLKDTNVFNYNGKAVFVEWNDKEKLHHVKFGDKEIGKGYNMIEDTYGNDLFLNGSNKFDFNMNHGRAPMFGFIGKMNENSGRVFVKIDPKTNEVKISDEFGKIEFKHGGNRPTMLGRNITHREDIK